MEVVERCFELFSAIVERLEKSREIYVLANGNNKRSRNKCETQTRKTAISRENITFAVLNFKELRELVRILRIDLRDKRIGAKRI